MPDSILRRILRAIKNSDAKQRMLYRPDLAAREHLFSASSTTDVVGDALGDFAGVAKLTSIYPWVAKAINVIANNIASLPLVHRRADGEPQTNSRIQSMLNEGNDTQSSVELWALWCAHMMLGGEGFFEFVPDGRGQPVEMWLRRPDHVGVIPDASRPQFPKAAGYLYGEGQGDRRTIERAMMLHCRLPNPLSDWRGLAPIAAVRQGITIDMFAQAWSKSLLKNNARPDFAIMAPSGLTATERDRYMADFLVRNQGNRHLPVILEEGVTDIKPFSFAPKDIEWLEQRRFSRDEVGAVFGVPDEIMGYGKDTYENFKTALEVLWTLTLKPLATLRDTALTRHMRREFPALLPAGDYLASDYGGVDVFSEDLAPKVDTASRLWRMGVPFAIVNERLGLGIPQFEGDSIAYLGTDVQPVAVALAPTVPPAPEPPVAAERSVGEEMGAEAKREAATFRRWLKRDPMRLVGWLAFDAAHLTYSDRAAIVSELEPVQRALQTLLLDPDDDEAESKIRVPAEERATRRIDGALRGIRDDFDLANADAAAIHNRFLEDEALRRALESALRDGVDLGVSAAIKQLARGGYGFDWTLVNEQARDWAGARAGESIVDLADSTRDGIRRALATWTETGAPLDELESTLQQWFSVDRARRIAATEVTRAYAEANVLSYRQSGVVIEVEWRTVHDPIVCPLCEPLDGKRRSIDAPSFDVGVGVPPRHPGCRCFIAPVVGNRTAPRTDWRERGDVDPEGGER